MALYLTISRGPRADLAEPILASSDQEIIRAVLSAIGAMGSERVENGTQPGRVVRLGDKHDERR